MSALSIGSDLLLADSAVTGIVFTRVAIIQAPQGWPRPQVVIHLISNRDHPTTGGAGQYWKTRIQTDCNGNDPTQAVLLGDAVLEALNGIVKADIAGCVDVDVLHAGVDFTEFNNEASSFRRVLQFDVWWRRG